MGIFSKKKIATTNGANQALMAEVALNSITDGVVIVGNDGVIKMINPAAVTMTGYPSADSAVGLSFLSVIKLQNDQGMPVPEAENPLVAAMRANAPFSSRKYLLATTQSERSVAVALNLVPVNGPGADKIITFRDITKELEEEGAQMEFISTASHEMRTPVASIEGYLGLALNPQTATIDARAQQYLMAAHQASQHLGKLFRDLLDTTKLDDGKIKPRLVPVEMTGTVKQIADGMMSKAASKRLKYSFGTADTGSFGGRRVDQLIYADVDVDFLREILDNLIENAIKYTPEGGAVWVNARGDGDKVLINVTDTGIGIASDDLTHIFQKFYRADNSQTRTIGGTGLGLYLVKSRVEAMGGKVWAESSFGEGSTFYISLPRLSAEEYEKRRIAIVNQQTIQAFAAPRPTAQPLQAQAASPPVATAAPVATTAQPAAQQPIANNQGDIQ